MNIAKKSAIFEVKKPLEVRSHFLKITNKNKTKQNKMVKFQPFFEVEKSLTLIYPTP